MFKILYKLSFLALVILTTAGIAFSQTLNTRAVANLKTDDLSIRLYSSPGSYQLQIIPPSKAKAIGDARVFWLKQPSRLVVDVIGFSSSLAHQEGVRSTEINSIRAGVHKEKVRLVIDIRDELVPDYKSRYDPESGGYLVNFTFNGTNSSEVKEVSDPVNELDKRPTRIIKEPKKPAPIIVKPRQVAAPVVAAAPVATVVTRSKESASKEIKSVTAKPRQVIPPRGEVSPPKEMKDESGSLKTMEKVAPAPNFAVLSGVEFKEFYGEKTSSALYLNTNLPTNFSIKKMDSTIYEMVLEKTKLDGPNLSLPQFPPDSFEGFEVVVSRQRGDDVVVRIYTPEGTNLVPFRAKGKLWVKAQ